MFSSCVMKRWVIFNTISHNLHDSDRDTNIRYFTLDVVYVRRNVAMSYISRMSKMILCRAFQSFCTFNTINTYMFNKLYDFVFIGSAVLPTRCHRVMLRVSNKKIVKKKLYLLGQQPTTLCAI